MENNIHRKKDSARLFWDSKPKRAANPKDIEFQTAEVVIPIRNMPVNFHILLRRISRFQ